jgi:hypothetical protein
MRLTISDQGDARPKHLIVFSHLRWDFVLQRPQHVLSRLADHYEVLFVEEPLRCDIGEQHLDVSDAAPGVKVLRPHTSADACGFSHEQVEPIRQMLTRYLAREGIADYVVWLCTPMGLPLLVPLRPQAIVYDCMDELSAFKNAPSRLRELEEELLRVADVVFTGGPSLYEAKRDRHANVHCLPSAVDANHYSRDRALADEAAVRRAVPVAVGCRVSTPRLLRGYRRATGPRPGVRPGLPTCRLALGHGRTGRQDLPGRLATSTEHSLAGTAALRPAAAARGELGLSACFRSRSTSRRVSFSPTKTLEYMAAQKPIVSTPVRDVSMLYGDQVRVATAGLAFIDACRASLAETAEETARRNAAMLELVARYSWDRTVQSMRQAIDAIVSSRPELRVSA